MATKRIIRRNKKKNPSIDKIDTVFLFVKNNFADSDLDNNGQIILYVNGNEKIDYMKSIFKNLKIEHDYDNGQLIGYTGIYLRDK